MRVKQKTSYLTCVNILLVNNNIRAKTVLVRNKEEVFYSPFLIITYRSSCHLWSGGRKVRGRGHGPRGHGIKILSKGVLIRA